MIELSKEERQSNALSGCSHITDSARDSSAGNGFSWRIQEKRVAKSSKVSPSVVFI